MAVCAVEHLGACDASPRAEVGRVVRGQREWQTGDCGEHGTVRAAGSWAVANGSGIGRRRRWSYSRL